MGREGFVVSRFVVVLEDLQPVSHVSWMFAFERRYTCGAAAFPPAHAMNEIARVVDFFVCPATFREMSENNMFPSARMNCVQ
jgi:hypothetical protein